MRPTAGQDLNKTETNFDKRKLTFLMIPFNVEASGKNNNLVRIHN